MLALAHSSPPHLAPLPIAPTRPSVVSPPHAISAEARRGAKEVLGLMEGELFRSSGEDQDTIHVLDRSQIGGHQVQLSWSLRLIRTSRFMYKFRSNCLAVDA
uniref:Uncharacterized protein n=1 Tax=Oryza barthii TaxID=65489 RepID=A0A0D3HTL3_9ORYZ